MAEENGVALPPAEDLQRGGIVGTGEIADCVVEDPSPCFFGDYGFVLKDAKPVEFVPCKGKQGWWLCNLCGHEFEEKDAAAEQVSPDCDECVIACPKCYANNLDDDGSLTHPSDRKKCETCDGTGFLEHNSPPWLEKCPACNSQHAE